LAEICIKSFFGWGFAPDPTGGAYRLPRPLPVVGRGRHRQRGKGREEGSKSGGRVLLETFPKPGGLVVYH